MTMHGLTDQEWIDYFDGVMEPEARDRLEAHLIGCELCWEFHDRMARTGERLRAAAERTRESLPFGDAQLHQALGSALGRLRGGAARPPASVRARLDDLTAVMAPMCGVQTTSQALRAAALSSPARSLDAVTSDNWEPFLASLTSIAAVMCGETGAHLVWESGQL